MDFVVKFVSIVYRTLRFFAVLKFVVAFLIGGVFTLEKACIFKFQVNLIACAMELSCGVIFGW